MQTNNYDLGKNKNTIQHALTSYIDGRNSRVAQARTKEDLLAIVDELDDMEIFTSASQRKKLEDMRRIIKGSLTFTRAWSYVYDFFLKGAGLGVINSRY